MYSLREHVAAADVWLLRPDMVAPAAAHELPEEDPRIRQPLPRSAHQRGMSGLEAHQELDARGLHGCLDGAAGLIGQRQRLFDQDVFASLCRSNRQRRMRIVMGSDNDCLNAGIVKHFRGVGGGMPCANQRL